MKLKKEDLTRFLRQFLLLSVMGVLNSLAFVWFYQTNGIAMGGATGIAQITNRLTGMPLGVIIIAINVPLFLLGWRLLGGGILISSLYTMLVSSVAVDLIPTLWSFAPMEPLLGCIYGGLCVGATGALVLQQGASFGGSDLTARLLKLKFQWLPIGRLMLMINLVVLALVALVFRDMNTLLYGLVALYVASIATDGVIYGMDKSEVAYIISNHYLEISQEITLNLHRGVTMLEGHGAWSGESKEVLMVAFKQRQTILVKQIVRDIDPNAFMIVCPAHEVLGSGFRFNRKNDL